MLETQVAASKAVQCPVQPNGTGASVLSLGAPSPPSASMRLIRDCRVEHFAYPMQFYRHALPALLRKHRFKPAPGTVYRTSFDTSAVRQARWASVFRTEPEASIPFTFCNTSATLILMRILADAGFNFRHVRHARSELTLPARGYDVGERYTLTVIPAPAVAVRRDRVTLTTQAEIADTSGTVVARQTDVWSVGGLTADDTAPAARPVAGQKDDWRALLVRRAMANGYDSATINVPADMGRQYGRISGDLNPTHLSQRAARLFGSPRAFVQGFCTINMVLAALMSTGRRPVTIGTSFIRPLFVDQTVELRIRGSELELCDADGALLAVGDWTGEG